MVLDVPHFMAQYGAGVVGVVVFADDDGAHPAERGDGVDVAVDGGALLFVCPQHALPYFAIENAELGQLGCQHDGHADDVEEGDDVPPIGASRFRCCQDCVGLRFVRGGHENGLRVAWQVLAHGVALPRQGVYVEQGKRERQHHDA